jgi:hypothetical protein
MPKAEPSGFQRPFPLRQLELKSLVDPRARSTARSRESMDQRVSKMLRSSVTGVVPEFVGTL